MRVNLSAYETRVLWFLFRKTYGWKKKTDWITLSQFSLCIGLDRRLIHRALKELSSKKMIVIERDDGKRLRYGFQKNYEKWKLSSKKMTVIDSDDQLSSIQIPTKETIQKKETTSLVNEPVDVSKTPHCPHKGIIAEYNRILGHVLPAVKPDLWNGKRAKYLQARWKEQEKRQDIAFWVGYFEYIRDRCPFLVGKRPGREGPFFADLEWIIRQPNMVKILEGKYEDRAN